MDENKTEPGTITGFANVAEPCPHCGKEFELTIEFRHPETMEHKRCPHCDLPIWFKAEKVIGGNTITVRVGKSMAPDPGGLLQSVAAAERSLVGFDVSTMSGKIQETLMNMRWAGQLEPELAAGIDDLWESSDSRYHLFVQAVVAAVWLELEDMKRSQAKETAVADDGIRSYRLTDDMDFMRQGAKLKAPQAASWLSVIVKQSDECPYAYLGRTVDLETKDIVVMLQWPGNPGPLKLFGVTIEPEEVVSE